MRDSAGKYIATQFVEVDNITSNLRKLYVEAYLGVSSNKTLNYWLVFQVSVPPMGWNSYFISKQSRKGGFLSFGLYIIFAFALHCKYFLFMQ